MDVLQLIINIIAVILCIFVLSRRYLSVLLYVSTSLLLVGQVMLALGALSRLGIINL